MCLRWSGGAWRMDAQGILLWMRCVCFLLRRVLRGIMFALAREHGYREGP